MSGLVNYDSDSGSESDTESRQAPAPPLPAPSASAAGAKKPFPKLVDRANPGRILVSLPAAAVDGSSRTTEDEQGPPAKRARTEGGGRFSGFRSALPPPKKTIATKPPSASASSSLPFSFKTSAEAAFSREPASTSAGAGGDEDNDFGADYGDGDDRGGPAGSGAFGGGLRLNLPPPKTETTKSTGPSIPDGMKPPEEVKLKGKPLMFKPLSVARKPMKKNGAKPSSSGGGGAADTRTTKGVATGSGPAAVSTATAPVPVEPPKKKPKVSLFSLGAEEEDDPSLKNDEESTSQAINGQYEPLFEDSISHANDPSAETAVTSDYNAYYQATLDEEDTSPSSITGQRIQQQHQSLGSIADDLNLSASARRELFGRGGSAAAQQASASKVVNFSIDAEYRLNEEMRASGQLNAPARAVKGIAPGKHNLRQLVNAVASQRDALEESFAKNRANQKDAAGRYGWR